MIGNGTGEGATVMTENGEARFLSYPADGAGERKREDL